jgi:hypothetical protein
MVAYVPTSATFNRPYVGPEQSHTSSHGCWQLARVIGKPHVHGHPPCHGGIGHHHGIPFPPDSRSSLATSSLPSAAHEKVAVFSLGEIIILFI